MTSKRLHLVLLIAIGVSFIGLAGGTYLANSLLTSQAKKLTTLKAKSMALQQQQQSLVKSKREIAQYSDLEKITKSVVPQDKNQAVAIRELLNIAESNGINVSSISFPASSLGASKTTSGAANASGVTAGGALGSNNPSSAATSKLSQLTPVRNIPGVYLLIISMQSDSSRPVPYSRFIHFLDDLEHNQRTAQVSNISLSPDSNNPNYVSFSLSLNEYIKP